MNKYIKTMFLSERVRGKVEAYSEVFIYRAVVIILLTLCFYINLGSFFYSFIMAAAVEVSVVDIYTSRKLPPAYWLLLKDEAELKAGSPEAVYKFSLINGLSVLVFIMLALTA